MKLMTERLNRGLGRDKDRIPMARIYGDADEDASILKC